MLTEDKEKHTLTTCRFGPRYTAQLSPPPWQPEFLGVCQYTRLHLPPLWTRHFPTRQLRRIVVGKGPVEFCEVGFLQVTFDSFKVIAVELNRHVDECCDNRERSSNCICAVSIMSKQRFTNTMFIIRSPPLLSDDVADFPFLPLIWNVP